MDAAEDAQEGHRAKRIRTLATESVVRILHVSDTHMCHREIEPKFGLPPADILIHTGDFADRSGPEDFEEVDAWLGKLRSSGLYKVIVVIFGNREWRSLAKDSVFDAELLEGVCNPQYNKAKLPSADYVLEHEMVELFGLRIFGSPWCPWHNSESPHRVGPMPGLKAAHERWKSAGETREHRFDEIPEGVDILLTHSAPRGIFDRFEGSWSHWGSSVELRKAVERAKPSVHLFGHIHEQRGHWMRQPSGTWEGGVEYERVPGEPWETFPPPPPEYPGQLIACTAMRNHPDLEGGVPACIAGPGRLILAKGAPGRWQFTLAPLEES
uniref:Calcineurin-like phosphoesterase domain-containing protein n=1 Tax=Alexandrium monilatum TaxID=311494 RepID=A0A7S4SEP1_9DINO|mmetsp:Transcript_13614/g.43456  ORF Transcript_13614/g.43456 Transcript_13614/m.43456 type:complete len:325 (-) Transcript_13614:58-1032(-)